MKNIVKIGVAIICLSSFASLTYAAQTGLYAGAGLGLSRLQTQNEFLFNKDTFPGKQTRELGGVGGRVFAGYNFNNYFGMETGIAHYAPSHYTASIADAKATVDYNLDALDVVGKAYLPLGESGFNLYALGGAAYVRSKFDAKSTSKSLPQYNAHDSYTEKKIRPVYGIGASYDIPQTSLTTNLELSRIQGSGDIKTSAKAIPNANMLTLNIGYNFG